MRFVAIFLLSLSIHGAVAQMRAINVAVTTKGLAHKYGRLEFEKVSERISPSQGMFQRKAYTVATKFKASEKIPPAILNESYVAITEFKSVTFSVDETKLTAEYRKVGQTHRFYVSPIAKSIRHHLFRRVLKGNYLLLESTGWKAGDAPNAIMGTAITAYKNGTSTIDNAGGNIYTRASDNLKDQIRTKIYGGTFQKS